MKHLPCGRLFALVTAAMALAGGAVAVPNLIHNGDFEQLAPVPGVSATGGRSDNWTLNGSPLAPAEWTLSGWFWGALKVVSSGAPEGNTYLHIEAGPEREAHLHQAVTGVWTGSYYALSLRYRGGPVGIGAYEYDAAGGAPRIVTLATGPASGDGWRQLESHYLPPAMGSVRLVVSVAAGATADVDDLRVCAAELPVEADADGWLNVKNHGASGSVFETTATTTAGSRQLTVVSPGDFKAGQQVFISKAAAQVVNARLRGPQWPEGKPLGGEVEVRGYEGSAGSWLSYTLEVDGTAPPTFRWSDDLRQAYGATRVPITGDWQPLSRGLEVRFNKGRAWAAGDMLTFSAKDTLLTTIEKIEDRVLTVKDAPNRTVAAAVLRHCDSSALQAVIDRAVRERKQVFIPAGRYRLASGLQVSNPSSLRLEGANGADAILDISEGEGSILRLEGGTEVEVRNLALVGHTGLADRPRDLRTCQGTTFRRATLKPCSGVSIAGTERVVFENVHASRMASAGFCSQEPEGFKPRAEKKLATRALTFLRCSVTDCAGNAFSNDDTAENLSLLYCRVQDVGSSAYEGPGRFIRIEGNYLRNSGPLWVGSMNDRVAHLDDLGCGQAVITGNTFEGTNPSAGILVQSGATQVTVANNLFVNFNGEDAIRVAATATGFPSQNVVISGNLIDLTDLSGQPKQRRGIYLNASEVIVSNNDIYVRGEPDPRVTGLRLDDPAVNVSLHDNLIRNCQTGIRTGRVGSVVTAVLDSRTFSEEQLPRQWPRSDRYRGWQVAWLTGKRANTLSAIASYDPATMRFRLTQPCNLRVGDRLEVFPASANWSIRGNTITDCNAPAILDSYGSPTSVFERNILVRGRATGVQAGLSVAGRFSVLDNRLFGFDEPGCAAVVLSPDPLGRTPLSLYRGNCVEQCATAIRETRKGLWAAARTAENDF